MIQAIGNYTRIVLESGKSEVVMRSLVKWAKILPSPPFLRIRRNTIVHSGKVQRLEDSENGIVMRVDKVDEPLPVSRRCISDVRQVLFPENV
jgi:DNA-binding LytR/AlgR family response regulator